MILTVFYRCHLRQCHQHLQLAQERTKFFGTVFREYSVLTKESKLSFIHYAGVLRICFDFAYRKSTFLSFLILNARNMTNLPSIELLSSK